MLKYNLVSRKNPQTKATMFYAQIAPVTPIDVTALSEAISRQCTVTIHDVQAVLSALDEHIANALLQGQSVRLGALGSFRPTLSSKAKTTAKEFKSSDIRGVNVRFTKGSSMRYKLSLKNPKLVLSLNTKEEKPTEGEHLEG